MDNDLAKEQRTLDENKLGKLDLQNGKYEEQLGLLQDITAEQLSLIHIYMRLLCGGASLDLAELTTIRSKLGF